MRALEDVVANSVGAELWPMVNDGLEAAQGLQQRTVNCALITHVREERCRRCQNMVGVFQRFPVPSRLPVSSHGFDL